MSSKPRLSSAGFTYSIAKESKNFLLVNQPMEAARRSGCDREGIPVERRYPSSAGRVLAGGTGYPPVEET